MLAFLFCLCLAVVGVVGQLTDADFAKIGYLLTSELDKRDERLYAKFDAVETKIDALETKIDALETKFDAKFNTLETKFDTLNSTLSNKFDTLNSTLSNKFDTLNSTLSNKFDTLNSTLSTQIGDLKTYFTTAFSDSHFFNRNRVEMMQNVSEQFVFCPKNSGTRHTVVYDGRVATVFTPHLDCLNSHAFSPTNNGNYILDDMYDLAIDIRCSNTSAALDISSVYEPSLGDEIITFGYGDTALVWQGVVSARVKNKCVSPAIHWGNGTVRFCSGEIVAQGHQHAGMSGAPVLNGCGYVGVAHAVNDKTNAPDANFAVIVPAYDVIRLIKKNLGRLPTLADCGQTALAPPLAALANCATNLPLTPLQIIINAIP
jgi:chaperonin cofactor prefoldin